jgi:DNA-nicking Smr family endonuclease
VKPPRGLSAEEAAAWATVAATVTRLNPPRNGDGDQPQAGGGDSAPSASPKASRLAPNPLRQPPPVRRLPPPRAGEDGLDSHWDRRFRAGSVEPDFTLDLHGHTLDSAHARLMDGLAQARVLGARVVLLIAGKPRPTEHADRAARRGAIRAKVLDWLAASSHAPAIAAIRKAHQRHGGEGALYIVLRRAQAR